MVTTCVTRPHHQERRHHEQRAGEHGQRVRPDEAGLQPPQPAGAAADRGGEPVDQPVDAPVVEVDQRPGEEDARLLEDRLVERVGVEVAPGGGDQRAGRLLLQRGAVAEQRPGQQRRRARSGPATAIGDRPVRSRCPAVRRPPPASPKTGVSQSTTGWPAGQPATTEPTASRISGIVMIGRRLVRVLDVLGPPLRAVEGEHEQPGHVERGEPGAEQRRPSRTARRSSRPARTRPR